MGEAQQSSVPTVTQKVHFGSLANEETVHKLQVLTVYTLFGRNNEAFSLAAAINRFFMYFIPLSLWFDNVKFQLPFAVEISIFSSGSGSLFVKFTLMKSMNLFNEKFTCW